MSQVDVLIVTALKEEYEAAREAGLRGYAGNPGVAVWEDRGIETPPYIIGDYVIAGGASMSVALARSTRMGSIATSPVVSSLIERLKPRCLAMCGVCAGNPTAVALGDVIVAELAYAYDEGKRTQQAFEGDHRQVPLPDSWVRSAQDLSPADLPSYGEASEDEAKIWLLERLNSAENPRIHPARARYFPRNTWREYLDALEKDGFLGRYGAELSLTEKGRLFVQRVLYDDAQGPQQLPFEVVVGPVASGNVVVKDDLTWEQLKQWGVRSVVGLEMEAAMIASTAYRLDVANWVVAKGVMDYADPRKDDRYKSFAARASAEVLYKLLALRVFSTESLRMRKSINSREQSPPLEPDSGHIVSDRCADSDGWRYPPGYRAVEGVEEMDAELAVLASSAATTIVTLLATDAWDQVKAKVGALWRRFKPEQADAIEAELTRGHLEIGSADETVALAITKDWESRLLRLLASDAAVVAELSYVVDELAPLRKARHVRGSVWQSAKAFGRSTVIQVGGDATLGELPLIPSGQPGAGAGAPGEGW